jgi:KUP system potassium uptake protein
MGDRRAARDLSLGRLAGDDAARGPRTAALTLGALGVVFGDIGTSPLYTVPAVFAANGHAVAPTRAGVYGVVSLVFWTITLVVSVKYVALIMRADNQGEGGIMALIALVKRTSPGARAAAVLLTLGAFGASLFYGDGIITPAISVLSAVEGLKVAAPAVSSLVVPIALTVLVVLFSIQRFGTGAVGQLFGPVMLVWFTVLAVAGLRQVIEHPGILQALSPSYGVALLLHHGGGALVVLGAVVLAVTGAEALYADMGHFGRRPIRRAWALVVFPALALNYMGQGALILDSPAALESPFFLLIPEWGRLAMVVLATAATVIASQAVISGAFSLTHQAVQLGFLPRLAIRRTSTREPGQVYAPVVNWLLCAGVAVLVTSFGSSGRLAGAYGVAVTGTMAITTVLFLFVVHNRWKAPLWAVLVGAAVFLTIDLGLFSATLTKVPHGGWVSLSLALVVFTILTTWRRGSEIVAANRIREEGPLRGFVEETRGKTPPVYRAPGTGVFPTTNRATTPLALRASVEHTNAMHQSVVIVLISTRNVPHVDPAERVTVDDLGYRDDGITHLTVRFGFRDRQNLPDTLALASGCGLESRIDLQHASYFVSRITVVRTNVRTMHPWRESLFVAMSRNEAGPIDHFGLSVDRTVIMGSLIGL